MLSALLWYLTLTLTGWLAFPLAYRLLPALRDRGYALSRALGLLLWGYFFWLSSSLHLAPNAPGSILTALVAWAILGWVLNRKAPRRPLRWLAENRRLVIWVEGVFLLAFVAAVYVRGLIPAAIGTEKPMELAFIDAILRSPTFPPHDPWLSGYAISYYYFGYVLVGMLARLLGIPGTIAFNLGLSTVFALTITGAFGLAYTLIRPQRPWPALLAPLFIALTGNWEGALEVLHRHGLLSPAFWQWLDIKDLAAPPQPPFGWTPQRFWWWWRASRVVTDHNLHGAVQEVIDEFPFFSYLLGDLHPHVLAYPFALLAVGLALNLYLGGSRRLRRYRLPARFAALQRLPLDWPGFLLAAVVLGGMAFLNTWDFPIYVGLFAAAWALRQARHTGWQAQIKPFFALGLLLGLTGGLLYFPFYLGFSSQAGGILPNLINPTRGVQLWVMFGPLLTPLFLWLLPVALQRQRSKQTALGLGTTLAAALGFAALLFVLALLFGWGIAHLPPLTPRMATAASAFLGITGAASWGELVGGAFQRHFGHAGGTLTLVALLGLAAFLLLPARRATNHAPGATSRHAFPALLTLFGALLVLFPNFFYLRDQFGTRMNTVFKFYYQGWLLWGLAAAYAVAWLARQRTRWQPLAQAGWAIALLLGLIYPALALPNRTNGFHATDGWTLNAGAYLQQQQPDEWAAIQWLSTAPLGALAEAVGGSYTQYARISTYSGQPAVLGWPGHESQWRGSGDLFAGREEDIRTLYTTPSWEEASRIIARYHIRYIVIAPLERNTYAVQENKFSRHLPLLFRQGETVIYGVAR